MVILLAILAQCSLKWNSHLLLCHKILLLPFQRTALFLQRTALSLHRPVLLCQPLPTRCIQAMFGCGI